jgi:CDP-glucose 4,6-dehydratase
MLKLDWSKAAHGLGWHPTLSLEEALRFTADWYRRCAAGDDMRRFTIQQILRFEELSNSVGQPPVPATSNPSL